MAAMTPAQPIDQQRLFGPQAANCFPRLVLAAMARPASFAPDLRGATHAGDSASQQFIDPAANRHCPCARLTDP